MPARRPLGGSLSLDRWISPAQQDRIELRLRRMAADTSWSDESAYMDFVVDRAIAQARTPTSDHRAT